MKKLIVIILMVMVAGFGFAQMQVPISGIYETVVFDNNVFDSFSGGPVTMDINMAVVFDSDSMFLIIGADYDMNGELTVDEFKNYKGYIGQLSDGNFFVGMQDAEFEFSFWYDPSNDMYRLLMMDKSDASYYVVPFRYAGDLDQ